MTHSSSTLNLNIFESSPSVIEKSVSDFRDLTQTQKKLISYLYSLALKASDHVFSSSFKEISENTGVKLSSVKTLLNRLSQKHFFQKTFKSRQLFFKVPPTLLKIHEYFLKSPDLNSPKILDVTQKIHLPQGTKKEAQVPQKNQLLQHETLSATTDTASGKAFSVALKNPSATKKNSGTRGETLRKSFGFRRVGESERQKILRVLGFVLCFFITAYLVTEGAMFFSKHLKTDFNPLVLSLCIEFLLVFFAGYKFRGAIKALTAKTLMTGIFLFSVGSYSYFSISSALKGYNFESRTAKISKTLSSQIREKQNLIKEYSQKGWIGEARKLSREKHHLTSELLKVQRSSSNQLPMTFLIGMVLAVSFRVLLQFANVFIAHELLKET